MNKYERAFDRVCERFKLNPSDWLPRFPAPKKGVYQASYPLVPEEERVGDESLPLDYSKPSYHRFYNGYDLIHNWVFHRREEKGKPPFEGPLAGVTGFLWEVSLGVYDTTNWKEAPPDRQPSIEEIVFGDRWSAGPGV